MAESFVPTSEINIQNTPFDSPKRPDRQEKNIISTFFTEATDTNHRKHESIRDLFVAKIDLEKILQETKKDNLKIEPMAIEGGMGTLLKITSVQDGESLVIKILTRYIYDVNILEGLKQMGKLINNERIIKETNTRLNYLIGREIDPEMVEITNALVLSNAISQHLGNKADDRFVPVKQTLWGGTSLIGYTMPFIEGDAMPLSDTDGDFQNFINSIGSDKIYRPDKDPNASNYIATRTGKTHIIDSEANEEHHTFVEIVKQWNSKTT